jgi:hypothetical protein
MTAVNFVQVLLAIELINAEMRSEVSMSVTIYAKF